MERTWSRPISTTTVIMDLFISRGAWLNSPIRPSLLENNGNGTFTDVTRAGRALEPVNSTYSCWGDYDNDGWLDVYIICELQTNRLYHNRGDGTFEEVSARAGVRWRCQVVTARVPTGSISTTTIIRICSWTT